MALANIFIAADSGSGNTASKNTGQAMSAKAAGLPNVILANIGDTIYPQATAANEPHVAANFWFAGSNFTKANSIATPGNHDNGAGGTAPDVTAYLDAWTGTMSKVTGVTPYIASGIPNTDQFIDVQGWRIFLINSGAIEIAAATPGWPVPHSSSFSASNARVQWLRSNWAPGLKNIVFTHHLPYSVFGSHNDNPQMDNLWNEMLGVNDGSGPHSCLLVGGHDHNMQIFNPRNASGTFPGITNIVCGGAEGHYTGNPPASNRSQPSWLQFANDTTLGFGLLEILSATQLRFSIYDQSGALMANTAALGTSGSAQQTITISGGVTTPTYEYSLDGAAYVPTPSSGTQKSFTLGSLAPGQHRIKIRDTTPGPDAQFAWVQSPVKPAQPTVDTILDATGNPVASGSHISGDKITITFH
jgi:calcineurin-like phosphoesterase family protein